jgi:2-polyprenyl-3-methyl-5-hydroxy-6-metoxy-1,4-benzoquinol methylase
VFSTRSYKKELLDLPGIPFGDIRQNMLELDVINKRLGGHRINIKGIKKILTGKEQGSIRILEIGCGDGNNLRYIAGWGKQNGIPLKLYGADINAECIQYARSIPGNNEIEFICADYRELNFNERPHIIFSSLFCHHFNDEDVIEILRWKHKNALRGFFINDLHRHPVAYFSIRLMTSLFSKSYLVKNDAPLSVARSFAKNEWRQFFKEANLDNYEVSWHWAFRWLIVCKK